MDNDVYSFFNLINEYEIKIPIIQRDYAQGRKVNSDICTNFLNTVKDSISNNTEINLDFVYGNIISDEKVFLPLDGQQRLTTLYLLHWYAYMKESKNTNIEIILKKFSYETRLSSRRFCEALVMNRIDVSDKDMKISNIIFDSEWFFMSWKQDPTISAMLNTIDIIHKIFYDTDNLWNILVENKIVTFHLLILENFGLSDDLYIKMNARGRLLTPFENFKAEIQDKIKKNEWEKNKQEKDKFAFKIDTVWMDFLWNNFRVKNTVDELHMNFITVLTMIKLQSNKMKDVDRIEIIQRLNETSAERNLIQYIYEETYQYIYECYDLYLKLYNENEIPEINFNMWRHKIDKSLLNQILIGTNTSYTHKVLFYAQTEYFLHNEKINVTNFLDWMRVIRNIVSRANLTPEGKRSDIVRSPESFSSAINLVKELSDGAGDIYLFLKDARINSYFAKEQIKEEKIKAKIICETPQNRSLIHELEDNELMRGKITIALRCAGYRNSIDQIDFTKLEKISNVFKKCFNRELGYDYSSEFDKLRRAMFTIEVNGRYEFYNYWWSYWNAGQAEKRRLFVQFRELEFFIEKPEFRGYFEKLVILLIDKDYQQIIDDFSKPDSMPNWQYRLIKEDLLETKCKSKFIAISPDRSYCYLLKSKRTSDLEGSPKIE